jgi:cystathionine beta-lyase family protein involved in aluminum resistance
MQNNEANIEKRSAAESLTDHTVSGAYRAIQYWAKTYDLDGDEVKLAINALEESKTAWARTDQISAFNFAKVLDAFREERVGEYDFSGTTGYGYGDNGRDKLENIYAKIFETESALVRWQIMSGTHAITLALSALTEPGDEIACLTGLPYDSVKTALDGMKRQKIEWKVVDLEDPRGTEEISDSRIKVCFVQRSMGYDTRQSVSVNKIESIISTAKNIRPDLICIVDNCYGELVEEKEPTAVGADIAAGSLMKNLGGGLAPTGGYIVGKRNLIDKVKDRFSAPGLGGEVGPTLGINRLLYQGLFLAPHMVGEAVKGAIFMSALFGLMGYGVRPACYDLRTDIIQAIDLVTSTNVRAFCEAVQSASPVDSYVTPEESMLPGYPDPVIMAAGTFIQGASLELSADAPMRSPYTVYVQGGLIKEQAVLAGLLAAKKMKSPERANPRSLDTA